MQRPIAELQIVIHDQVLHLPHFKGDAHRDADGADGQQLDHAFNAHRPVRPDAFQRRQTHHLRAIKEQVPRAALAGIDHELRHRLSEQFTDGTAGHFVGDIKSIDVNYLAGVLFDLRQRRLGPVKSF